MRPMAWTMGLQAASELARRSLTNDSVIVSDKLADAVCVRERVEEANGVKSWLALPVCEMDAVKDADGLSVSDCDSVAVADAEGVPVSVIDADVVVG